MATESTQISDSVVVVSVILILGFFFFSWWATAKKLQISFKFHWLFAHLLGFVAGMVSIFPAALVSAFYSVVSPVAGLGWGAALGYFAWVIFNKISLLGCATDKTLQSCLEITSTGINTEKTTVQIKPDSSEIESVRRQSLVAMKSSTVARQRDLKICDDTKAPQTLANTTDSVKTSNFIADIEFDYRDASGNASHRRVEVHSIDDEYFEGFCHKAMATRTFVIGRVRGKVLDRDTGELLPPKKWASGVRNDPRNSGVVESRGWKSPDDIEEEERERPIEILFTGFSKERTAELEEQAAIFDLVVRKNVTKGLKYLCAGPNAGPAKLAKAEAAGVEIMDESEFVQLLIKC